VFGIDNPLSSHLPHLAAPRLSAAARLRVIWDLPQADRQTRAMICWPRSRWEEIPPGMAY